MENAFQQLMQFKDQSEDAFNNLSNLRDENEKLKKQLNMANKQLKVTVGKVYNKKTNKDE